MASIFSVTQAVPPGGGPGQTAPPDLPTTGDHGGSAYRWLIGWGVMLVFLSLFNKTRVGHVMLYYSIWLLLLFLVVTQYKFITAALGPVGEPLPSTKIGAN
jgi:hypothetical protein